jgi:hypothetical protein
MMQKLEQSWLDQHYLKYYMNEDLRVPKMQFAQRQNNVLIFLYIRLEDNL